MVPFLYAEANFGLVDRLGGSLNIEAAYHRQNETAYGFGDVSLSLKYLAVPYTQTVPAIVFGLQTQFPSEDQHLGLGTGAYELNPFIGLLKTFDTVIVQGNVGWLKQATHAHESACSYDLSADVPVYQRKFYLLIETSGQAGRSKQATIAPGREVPVSQEILCGNRYPDRINQRH